MLPLAEIEMFVTKNSGCIDPAHDNDHLRRVGRGAAWFVQVSGGSRTEQQAAYVAGLLHDIVRPLSEKAVGHEIASAAVAKKLLRRLRVDATTAAEITRTIEDHRGATKWNNAVHQSVYFADKVFEQMGAIVLFRRCTWVGECRKIQEDTVTDSVIGQFAQRLKKYRPSMFPRSFRPLITAQYAWPVRFLRALKTEEAWALYVAASGFRNGAFDKLPVHMFVQGFKPLTDKDATARNEALRYLSGRKWNEWAALVRH